MPYDQTLEETTLSKLLKTMLKVSPQIRGLDYINSITKNFAAELCFNYVCVGRVSVDDPYLLETDIFLNKDTVYPNMSLRLNADALKTYASKRAFTCLDAAKNIFLEKCDCLENRNFSLVGAPLYSHDDQLMGYLFALCDCPTIRTHGKVIENVIEFLANRIAVEYERINAEEQARRINQELEEIIEIRTAHLKKALAELNLKDQQLELRYNENVNMLRLLSHDLSNPLQILGMSLESLADRLPSEYLRLIDRMKRSTDTMSQILYLVRELQAFGAGKKELKIEPVCLDEIVEKTKFYFQDKLKEKNITLNYYVEPSITPKVMAEKISLSNNVFNNLISNAIKFSENGSSIDISIKQNNDQTVVLVSDRGIGIPEELLPVLFSYNRETSRPGTKGEKGTGFGLPLVKLFLDLYKVKVSVSSKTKEQDSINHGTAFELVFQSAA